MSASGPAVTMTAPAVGQYNITLEVWDFAGGYAQTITAMSVDASNVLNWRSATPGFARSSASAVLPRPSAVLSLNGTVSDTMTVKARTNGWTWVSFDASGSSDGRGSQLVYNWKITQMKPSTSVLALMLPFQQPAGLVQRYVSLHLPSVFMTCTFLKGPPGGHPSPSYFELHDQPDTA